MAKVVHIRDELSIIIANLADDLLQDRSGWLDPVAALDRVHAGSTRSRRSSGCAPARVDR